MTITNNNIIYSNSEEITINKDIQSQIELLYFDLLKFYNIYENLNKFTQIINGKVLNISLRLIDWFSTNYAKKYYTTYNINIGQDNQKRFKVFDSYKLKLRAYGKDNFDAFSRGKRILVPTNDISVKPKETTIGQMNFFRWAIENNIIEYILENFDSIKNDMDSRSSTSKKKELTVTDDNTKTRKKREELSVSASKCIIKEKVTITIKFSS
jgi:hypothetical protein